jgi:hypothetical protein
VHRRDPHQPALVCLTGARFEDGELVIEYEAAWADGVPDVNGGYHLHLYGGDGTDPPADVMGAHAPQPGRWQVEDRSPPVRYPADHPFVTEGLADNPKCVPASPIPRTRWCPRATATPRATASRSNALTADRSATART